MNKEDLKELSKLFEEVKDKNEDEFGGFKQLPDGEYSCKIDQLEITESKSGKPMFVATYVVRKGEFKGDTHKQFIMLCGNDETQAQRNINHYARVIKELGIDTTQGLDYTFKNLDEAVEEDVTITLKTTVGSNGKKYTHTSVEKN